MNVARIAQRAARCWPDAVLAAGGLAFGSLSVTYPFGHDQALYYYVGREWALRGAIPYRDIFDHKTPGIYALHALLISLFGERLWAIRVAELGCVLVLGIIGAALATPRAELPRRGLCGFGVLIASVLHYGFFDFWSSAQSELWYTTLGLGAVACVMRSRSSRWALRAGLVAGAAVIMKPPSIWFVLVAGGLALARTPHKARHDSERRRRWRTLSRGAEFLAGAAVIPAVALGYLASKCAIAPMVDIVVGANGYYVRHEPGVHSFIDIFDAVWRAVRDFSPPLFVLALAMLAGVIHAVRLGDRERIKLYSVAFVLGLASLAAVGMQGKFYWLHWLPVIGPMCLCACLAVNHLSDVAFARAPWRGPAIATAVFLGAYTLTPHASAMWLRESKHAFDWIRGEVTLEERRSHFTLHFMAFYYGDSERVAEWLKANSSTGNTVAVRGFHPEIYALSGLRYNGRFFWTHFLVDPRRAYRRLDYLAEDRAVFERSPPRFFISNTDANDGIDSAGWAISNFGYIERARFGKYIILESRARERTETATLP